MIFVENYIKKCKYLSDLYPERFASDTQFT